MGVESMHEGFEGMGDRVLKGFHTSNEFVKVFLHVVKGFERYLGLLGEME